jgi:hypothetical protein
VIGSLPGGLGSVSDATEETQALIDNVYKKQITMFFYINTF